MADVADPLGGAWAIEALTEEIVVRARDYIARIDELGGARQALERGFQQDEIADAAYRHQRAVEEGSVQVVGVNQCCLVKPIIYLISLKQIIDSIPN